jgi:PKD domain/Bacterial Ig-like domain (group 1)
MVTHRRTLLIAVASFFALVAACDKVPLLAPTGSNISLFLSTNSASLNSEVTIVATVIENGQSAGGSGGTGGTTGAGTPVQNGTLISFTTTIGTIEPSEARTHNGTVSVKLITGSTSGTANITAYSGGASKQGTLKIGTAAAKTVLVTTNPQSLGPSGGTAQVFVTVTDEGGSGIGGIPVSLSTDNGSLSASTVTTDSSGTATASLTTTATAKVSATVGGLAVVVATVPVTARKLLSFTVNTANATIGTPIVFTVTPSGTTAAPVNISNVHVAFGDGGSRDTGPITKETAVPYTFTSTGIYTATATVPGEEGLNTTVSIGSLPITVTPVPSPATVNTPVTFTASNIGSAQIDYYEWTFDDGTPVTRTSGPQLVHTFSSRGTKNARVDAFGISGSKLGTASTSLTVQ